MSETLKVFVYNINGAIVEEHPYSEFILVYNNVMEHNIEFDNDIWNVYSGARFPPSGFKWDDAQKQFIEKTLNEKYADGELNLPHDMVVREGKIIKLTTTDMVLAGKVKLTHFQKIENDVIVNKTHKELHNDGILTKIMYVDIIRQSLKQKFDDVINDYYNRVAPSYVVGHYTVHKEKAQLWLDYKDDKKQTLLTSNDSDFGFILTGVTTIEKADTNANAKINEVVRWTNFYFTNLNILQNAYVSFDTLAEKDVNVDELEKFVKDISFTSINDVK